MIDVINAASRKIRIDFKFVLYVFIAILPLELIVSGSFFTIPKIIGLATLIFFVFFLMERKLRIYLDLSSKIFLLFLVYCIATNFWSDYPDISLTRTFTILQILILYIIIINTVDSKSSLNMLLVVSTIGGALLGISGLMELRQMGGATNRIAGFSQNANLYFTMAIFLIPAMSWCIKFNKNKLIKLFSITVMFMLFFTSLFTESRGGLISLGVFVISYFLFSKNKLSIILIIITMSSLAYFFAPDGFWPRFLDIGVESTDRFSVLWPAGWQAFLSNIFIGHGIGTSEFLLPNYLPGLTYYYISPHNSLLALGIDLGIFGTILYLAMIAIPTYKLAVLCFKRKNTRRTNTEEFGVILFCVLIAYLASWFKSGGFEYFKYLWVLVGLEICVVNIITRERRSIDISMLNRRALHTQLPTKVSII